METFQDFLISDTDKSVIPNPFVKSNVPGHDIFLVPDLILKRVYGGEGERGEERGQSR